MAYIQNPGRGPMMKTGRGPAIASLTNNDKKKPKMVTVKATGDGEEWNIDVAEGSNMHKQSMELGTVPVEFRQINVNKSNDPFASGISPAEYKSRMKFFADKEK